MAYGPNWFLGVDVLFDLLFFLITGVIAITFYRAYRFFRKPEYQWLSWGFGTLGIGYLFFAVINLLIDANDAGIIDIIFRKWLDVETVVPVLLQLRAFIVLAGLVILLFVYYDIRDWLLRILLLFLVLFSPIWAAHPTIAVPRTDLFFALTATLHLFISLKILEYYAKHRQRSTLIVFWGFLLNAIGSFLFGLTFIHPLMYVVAYAVKLVGFGLIFGSLVSLWRR